MKNLFLITLFFVCTHINSADQLACFAQIAGADDTVKDCLQALVQIGKSDGSGFNSFQSLVDAVDQQIQSETELLEAQIQFFKCLESDDKRMAYIASFSEDQKRAMQAALIEYLTSNGCKDLVEKVLEKHPGQVVAQQKTATRLPLSVPDAAVALKELSLVKNAKKSKPKKEKFIRKAYQNLESSHKWRLRSSKIISGSEGLQEAYMFQCSNCWAHIKGSSFFKEHMLICKE